MIVQHWLTISLLYSTAYSQYMRPTCNIITHQYTIIDIKSSVAHNAELLNGTLTLSLSDCLQNCCENDRCDLAVFKNNGTSRGNRNCYFVHCGVDENCLLVSQSRFTAVSIKKDVEVNTKPPDAIVEPANDTTTETSVVATAPDDTNAGTSNATTEPTDATTKPTDATTEPTDTTTKPTDATTEPTNATTKSTDATTEPTDATTEPTDATTKPTEADHTTTGAVITMPTLPSNNESSNSTLESSVSQIISSMEHESALVVSTSIIITSTTTSSISSSSTKSISNTTTTAIPTTSTAAVNRIGNDKTADNQKVIHTSAGSSGPEKEPNADDRRLCGNADCSHSKAAGLAVACLLVILLLIIVIVVVVKKSWDRHRSKRYKRIDYLIDGMYS